MGQKKLIDTLGRKDLAAGTPSIFSRMHQGWAGNEEGRETTDEKMTLSGRGGGLGRFAGGIFRGFGQRGFGKTDRSYSKSYLDESKG
tara:strand:+ start:40 stop:300 length:261 start_codon:yes stop_codon:yes gene_type:complete